MAAPGARFLEAEPDSCLMRTADDAALVVEACFSHRAAAALLFPPNLTANFFDLSSREAGAVLQKLRNYGIRLAIVCPPGTVKFSTRFHDLMTEENAGADFRIFESAGPARKWLAR